MLQMPEVAGETALEEVSETEDPYKVLIATILSARTKDEQTTKASERLFSVYGTPESLASADPEKVMELIRSVGFYRVKTRRIMEVARILVEKYGGRVPSDLDELLTLPSVGRKTGNCVLVYGFGKPAIPVDTHVHRITNRLGMVSTKTPEKTEEALAAILDKRYWLELNELLVRFGQTICKPIGPKCDICILSSICPYYSEVVKPKLS